MSTIFINRTSFFNASILPKVDELARERSCTRSDVLRDIFCTSFKYPSAQRSAEQIEIDHALEASTELERGKNKCVAVYVDDKFQDVLLIYYTARRGRYGKAIEHILISYFSIPTDDDGFRDDVVRLLCVASAEPTSENLKRAVLH
jgi:hypothetical protein